MSETSVADTPEALATPLCVGCLEPKRVNAYRWTGATRHTLCKDCETAQNEQPPDATFDERMIEGPLLTNEQQANLYMNTAICLMTSITPADVTSMPVEKRIVAANQSIDRALAMQGRPSQVIAVHNIDDKLALLEKAKTILEQRVAPVTIEASASSCVTSP